jgi:DNA-binding MarR family transcriptional regulator
MDSIPINELSASPDDVSSESTVEDTALHSSMERNAAIFGSTASEAQSIRLIASLRRTSNLLQRLVDAHARPSNLSLGRVNVLLALNGSAEGRLPLHAVATILDVTRGNVSNLVQSLVDDGFVATEADPDDGRSQFVRLTAAGRVALRDYVPTHYRTIDALCAGLSTAQKEELIALLDRLRSTARGAG